MVVSAVGLRGEESPFRAKLPIARLNRYISAKALLDKDLEAALDCRTEKQRLAIEWCPILPWEENDVWTQLGTSLEEVNHRRSLYKEGQIDGALRGFVGHPAYVYGNSRVSCVLCFMASKNDLRVGATYNPDLYRLMVALEEETGFSYQQRRWLRDILDEKAGNLDHDLDGGGGLVDLIYDEDDISLIDEMLMSVLPSSPAA